MTHIPILLQLPGLEEFAWHKTGLDMSLSPCLSEVDDVLRRANATEYGLASGVFTRDISKALYVSERLNAGTVFVNTYNKTDVASPFGGFKQSGFGKDLGKKKVAAVTLIE